MTVLHGKDADWHVSMATTEKPGVGDKWGSGRKEGTEVERVNKMTLINPSCPDNNDTNE